MSNEFRPNAYYEPWGPLIGKNFKPKSVTYNDVITASVAWGLTLINVGIAVWLGWKQTKGSRSPLRSGYVWMIWIELLVSVQMGLQTYLHLLKIIRPSFAMYFTHLIYWCIQVQLLLQIIINRIRIIVPDRRHSTRIMVGTAIAVTIINVSVAIIWTPAVLQINETWQHINVIWDRIEKVIYLVMDAGLNWYFLKVVKENLISNGLQKYNKLLRFNQRIIVLSLLMDVMIIAAMFLPNSLVYIMFHPLAYLVKLNIEMTMANLIKRIAISTSRRTGNASIANEFNSSSNQSSTGKSSRRTRTGSTTLFELTHIFSSKSHSGKKHDDRAVSFAPTGNQIKETREITITNEPNPEYETGELDIEYGASRGHTPDPKMGFAKDRVFVKTKSLESVSNTEGAESIKSEDAQKRGDSDDEIALVMQSNSGWGKLTR